MSSSLATPVLPTSLTLPFPPSTVSALDQAARILQSDGLVAFPTETVYGLGASALSETATRNIYTAKGRPSDNPLIVHVSSREMLHDLLPGGRDGVPALYEPLLDRFWPGPLSLIFPLSSSSADSPTCSSSSTSEEEEEEEERRRRRREQPPKLRLASTVTAGLSSVAIRMPRHPLALSLISRCNLPLAAPSANVSSRPSPTTAQHVQHDLGTGRGVGVILDGGECAVGVESTVVDFVPGEEEEGGGGVGEGELRVLRVGGVSVEELEKCLADAGMMRRSMVDGSGIVGDDLVNGIGSGNGGGKRIKVYARDFKSTELEAAPTTPGMKYKHYSPSNSKVVLVRPATLDTTPSLSIVISLLLDTLNSPPSSNSNSSSASTTKPPPQRRRRPRIGLMFTNELLAKTFPDTSSTVLESPTTLSLTSPSPSPSSSSSGFSSPTQPQLLTYPLGSSSRPLEAAQRLFAGLRYFDQLPTNGTSKGKEEEEEEEKKDGVELILVEAIDESGVGLAVMERARKAAGGADVVDFSLG
ncbi:translation factor [Meredithblackwellia eburnea MCA 4105]